MITTAHRMESLSRAYLQAVAAQAGLNYSVHTYDYGVDLTLREVIDVNGVYLDSGMQVDVQLKSTTRAVDTDEVIKVDLDVRTYDYLRAADAPVLRVLVVLVMPAEETGWVVQSADGLSIHRCAYWMVLRGVPESGSVSSVRVTIPNAQILTASALRDLTRSPVERRQP